MKIRNSKDFLMYFGLDTSRYVAGGVLIIHPSRDIWNVDYNTLFKYCKNLDLFYELVQDFERIGDVYKFVNDNSESDRLFEFTQEGCPIVLTAKQFDSMVSDLIPLAEEYNLHYNYPSYDFWREE